VERIILAASRRESFSSEVEHHSIAITPITTTTTASFGPRAFGLRRHANPTKEWISLYLSDVEEERQRRKRWGDDAVLSPIPVRGSHASLALVSDTPCRMGTVPIATRILECRLEFSEDSLSWRELKATMGKERDNILTSDGLLDLIAVNKFYDAKPHMEY
jgi:hypothetical protein